VLSFLFPFFSSSEPWCLSIVTCQELDDSWKFSSFWPPLVLLRNKVQGYFAGGTDCQKFLWLHYIC
jgi:hypothetical protein